MGVELGALVFSFKSSFGMNYIPLFERVKRLLYTEYRSYTKIAFEVGQTYTSNFDCAEAKDNRPAH